MESITLAYSDIALGGNSDKIYILKIEKKGNGYVVNYENGRRGGTMHSGTRTAFPVSLEEAKAKFNRIVAEQLKQGYVPPKAKEQAGPALGPALMAPNTNPTRTPYPVQKLIEVKTEQEADALLNSPKFWLQKKENGEFCQIQKRRNGTYVRFNKEGNPVDRALPDLVLYDLKKIPAKTFFIEGELFEKKLRGVAESSNRFVAYNLWELDGEDFTLAHYAARYDALEELIIPADLKYVTVVATWKTKPQKTEGAKALKKIRAEGLVFKKFGSRNGHVKFKWTKTLSAVVIAKGRDDHNNAVLGLLNDEWGGDKYVEVGSCSLNGKEHVEVGHVIEVRYLYASADRRIVQPRMLEVRTDVNPKECTLDQLIYREGVNIG